VLLPLGRYDEAERDAAAAVAADPLSPVTRIHLSNIHRARGALDRAAAAVDPTAGHVQTMSRALTYSMMGRRKEAIELFEGVMALTAVPYLAIGHACFHILCDQFDEALEHLMQATADRHPFVPVMTTVNPRFRHSVAGQRILDVLGIPH